MSEPRPDASARSARLGLLLLVALALLLRAPALERNLPCDPEPDAVVVKQALYLDAKWRDEERTVPALNRQYPPLLALGLAALPGSLAPARADGVLEHELAAAARSYRIGRVYVLLLALGAIPATFLLARRALGARWALVAAGLVALSSLHALYSTQARPHAPLATLVALALLALAARLRRPNAATALLAGAASALCIACLHNGFAVLAPVAAVELVLLLRRGARSLVATLLGALLVALPIGAAAVLSYPELFGRAETFEYFVPQVGEQLNLSGHLVRIADFNGAGFGLVLGFLAGQEPVLLALLLAAAVLAPRALRAARAARAQRGEHSGAWRALASAEHAEVFVALVFGAAYLVAIGIYARTFGRFLLPLLPALAFAGAWAARGLFEPRARAAWLAPCAVLALAALPSARLAWLWTRDTTPEQAGAWIAANVPEDALVAVPLGLDVGLPVDAARSEVVPSYLRSPWAAHLIRHPDVAAALGGPRVLHSGYMPGMDLLGPSAEGLARELRSRGGAQFVLVEPDESYLVDPRRRPAPAGANGAAEVPYRSAIGKRRYPRGHHPEQGVLPLVEFGDASAPRLADSLGYSLDDCAPWTLWRVPRFGQRLALYRDWGAAAGASDRSKNPENASGK
ncbi:MAG: hypothetical protein EPO68_10200 [Planctomycetota bacterium]|nr:MAG: hypothetical protein EPO68_10200 [Planctomycetota bacterium]